MFLFKHPLSFRFSNGICLDDLPLSYADVVGAVDGVITKPGYGIVSDCLAHGTPVIYTDRGFFPEYDILVQEMAKQLIDCLLYPHADFYAGKLASSHPSTRKATSSDPHPALQWRRSLRRDYSAISKLAVTSGHCRLFPQSACRVGRTYKIPNSKHQITNKFQIPILNDQNKFEILKLGTRPQGGESKRSADNFGHCDLFDICDL